MTTVPVQINVSGTGAGGIFLPTWPPETSRTIPNYAGTGVNIYQELFGALSQDPAHPLSRISVANSSFSLDPFVGCPARCAYCVVSSSARDLNGPQHPGDESFSVPSQPKQVFSGKDLVAALIRHPAFIAHRSVISIGTASTESFLPSTHSETWRIMEALLLAGLRNPIWIVTKMGIADHVVGYWPDRVTELKRNGIPLIISVTYSAMPQQIEPYAGDRFRNLDQLRCRGAFVSHVNDSREHLERAFLASAGRVDAICVGGLRPDPGIRLIWERVYNLAPDLLPTTSVKDLPEHIKETVQSLVDQSGLSVPIMERSSETICYFLQRPDYNLYKYRRNESKAFLFVPIQDQKRISKRSGLLLNELVDRFANSLRLNVSATCRGCEINLSRDLSYQEHRLLLHSIGHSGLLD